MQIFCAEAIALHGTCLYYATEADEEEIHYVHSALAPAKAYEDKSVMVFGPHAET